MQTTPYPSPSVPTPPARSLRIVLFYHSVESDWNNGNAHFLRGVATELQARGHQVRIFEPADGWSRASLLKWEGAGPLDDFRRAYPTLSGTLYRLEAEERASPPAPASGKGPADWINCEDRVAPTMSAAASGSETVGREAADFVVRSGEVPVRDGGRGDAPDLNVGRDRAVHLLGDHGGVLDSVAIGNDSSNVEALSEAAAVPAPGAGDRADLEVKQGGTPLDLEDALSDVDLVLVHEWNEPALIRQIGKVRKDGGCFVLLFHDTHHRAVTDPEAMSSVDLSGYDGVLAFGGVLRDLYIRRGWAARAWTWHEGADTRVFTPPQVEGERSGLVWIGNWGDEERTSELEEFLLRPVQALGMPATAYGVRYPPDGLVGLARAGVDFAGRLQNFAVPAVFARHAVTVHIPRRPYARALPGIPTIRVFEALACGIPLVSAPWDDAEHLFSPGDDYLVARDGGEMAAHLARIMADREYAAELAAHGLATVRARHTCAHRVDELLAVYQEVRGGGAGPALIV